MNATVADGLARARRLWERIVASRPVAWIRAHKRALAIAILVTFTALLATYVALNPGIVIDALAIGWANLALLLVLYSAVLVTHFGVLVSTVRLAGARLPVGESFLLTVYSTVSNFFGPMQSGPGIRAVYLKSRIGMRFRDYLLATVYYFFVFGVINAAALFLTTMPWLSALIVVVGIVVVIVAVRRMSLVHAWPWVVAIALVTIVQFALMTVIFGVEIAAVSSPGEYSPMQILVYSGSANLSLFVSITPGAIGIREAFLVFAQGLHGVPLDIIVAAGIVDRAFYALFLAVLFGISSMFHLGRMLRTKSDAQPVGDAVDGE
ncbi:hypothetical protein SAMN05428970_3294 [Agromyces sp. CF514]|uniref:hypothetical protein n=1 Tax=Agromyces sp. CF514 TaxID=1881031 RepID=UPI0008E4A22F|nr:hypothetical protein [Agromyces sp. CF514]SFR86353.1 hypothetical protein SAMN05428970_3294 [Agromyces sp. CF514]